MDEFFQSETMRINAPKGTKIVYTGKNGYDSDKKHADSHLTINATYTVEETEIHSWSSKVKIKENGEWFNTVHFVELN